MAKKKSKWKRNVWIVLILILLVGGYLYVSSNTKKTLTEYAKSSIIENTVERQKIEVKTTGNGTIQPYSRYEINSPVTGVVKYINYQQGEYIKKDKTLMKIGDTTIKVPYAGTLITLNTEEDAYVTTGNIGNSNSVSMPTSATGTQTLASTDSPIAVIADMEKVKFNLEIDELDINKVKLGMEVRVTADAIEGKEFIGKVDKIAQEGKSSNGVTTYDVTVVIEDYGELKIGMNVDATLILDQRESVLVIPMDAINKTGEEVYVYVKDDSYQDTEKKNAQPMMTAPKNMSEVKGYKKVPITVGISNKDNIEVTGGLEEGQKVYSVSNSKSLTEYMLEQSSGSGMSVAGHSM